MAACAGGRVAPFPPDAQRRGPPPAPGGGCRDIVCLSTKLAGRAELAWIVMMRHCESQRVQRVAKRSRVSFGERFRLNGHNARLVFAFSAPP